MKSKLILIIATFCLAGLGLVTVFGPILHLMTAVTGHHEYRVFGHSSVIVSLPVVGALLIYLSGFVYHRRLFAVHFGAGLAIALSAYEYGLLGPALLTTISVVLTCVFCIIYIVGRRLFTIHNNFEGLGEYIRPIIVIAAIGFAYGVIGFNLLDERFFHVEVTLKETILLSIGSIASLNGLIVESTRVGQLFIDSLNGVGIVIFILLINALFRPLRLKFFSAQQHDFDLVRQILQESSESSEDFFKVWPRDKHYFFSEDKKSFIAYKQEGRTIVVLGGPVGNRDTQGKLIGSFTDYCQSLGWSMAVVNADAYTRRLYAKRGFSSLLIGNEAVVSIPAFMRDVRTNKHFRYVANKARRDELRVEEWRNLNMQQIAELRAISQEWLARGGRREYTFFMGYFDARYVQQCRIFVVKQHGHAVAFVNIIPSFVEGAASIDMFRSRSECSSVVMHFLLSQVLTHLDGEGVQTLNLGLSPLSGLKDDERDIPKALLRSIRFLGSTYYSFQGLEQFKGKFKPEWGKRWLLVSGVQANIIRVSRDIESVSRYEPYGDWRMYVSTLLGVVVLTLSLYLVLG